METIVMNTENKKTNETYGFRSTFADKLDLKDPNKNMALANLSIYYTWKNIKSACNNNKFSNLEWRIWVALWDIFYSTHSSLFWIHY